MEGPRLRKWPLRRPKGGWRRTRLRRWTKAEGSDKIALKEGGRFVFLTILKVWLAAINLLAFALCGLDKWKAQRGLWRIRERTLLGAAALGGAPGLLAGMAVFRHKTRRKKFTWGVPAILAAQSAGAFWVLWYFIG